MRLFIVVLVVLLVGCRSQRDLQVLESEPDTGRVTKRMVSRGDIDQVTSRAVITKVSYTLKDRSGLKSHASPVCMLAGGLPDEFKYREVARISATKRTYGSVDEVLQAMADEGRRIGVEAIMGLQASQKFKSPFPWRYTSPVGQGWLIKLDPDSLPLDCETLGGKPS
jgi:hypothetical protein